MGTGRQIHLSSCWTGPHFRVIRACIWPTLLSPKKRMLETVFRVECSFSVHRNRHNHCNWCRFPSKYLNYELQLGHCWGGVLETAWSRLSILNMHCPSDVNRDTVRSSCIGGGGDGSPARHHLCLFCRLSAGV